MKCPKFPVFIFFQNNFATKPNGIGLFAIERKIALHCGSDDIYHAIPQYHVAVNYLVGGIAFSFVHCFGSSMVTAESILLGSG